MIKISMERIDQSPLRFDAENAILAENLHKRYGDQAVLNGLSFHVPRGAIGLYLGPNGAGKTTTFRILAGLETPTQGRVEILGHPNPGALKNQVGVTLEEPRFYPWLSGLENLEIVGHYRNVPKVRAWAKDALARVGLSAAANRAFVKYSLGMRQRLYLASTLFPGVRLILLDEPTNGLDVEGRDQIWSTLETLKNEGVGLFVSTHQVLEAERYADHVVVLHAGRIAYNGTYQDLTKHRRVVIDVEDPQAAVVALQRFGVASSAGKNSVVANVAPTLAVRTVTQLEQSGVRVAGSRPEDLEELYWRLKNESLA